MFKVRILIIFNIFISDSWRLTPWSWSTFYKMSIGTRNKNILGLWLGISVNLKILNINIMWFLEGYYDPWRPDLHFTRCVMTHVLMVTVEHLILITLKSNTINYLKRIVHTCNKNSLAHHNHPLQTYLQCNSISEKKMHISNFNLSCVNLSLHSKNYVEILEQYGTNTSFVYLPMW